MTVHPASEGLAMEAQWRRFVTIFLSVFFGGLATILLFLVVIDPYDTGRFPTFMPAGIDDTQQNVNTASRGRNSMFDAAIIGNSHGQLIDPDRLSRLTGLSFVQMTTPGSGPREQLLIARYFLRHHSGKARALILTFDQTWCTHDPALPALYNLPLWLFSESDLEYVAGLLNIRSIAAARRRVGMALGQSMPVAPSGYWNYETGKEWNFHPPRTDTRSREGYDGQINTEFPAVAALDTFLAGVPRKVKIVAIWPPQYFLLLPHPGSSAARELEICKAMIEKHVAARTGGLFDLLLDSELSRDPKNFMDQDHYRGNIARLIENKIVDHVRDGEK